MLKVPVERFLNNNNNNKLKVIRHFGVCSNQNLKKKYT